MTGVSATVRSPSPRAASGAPARYVYILGAGHSGSTLLALLLGSHPRVCTIGEAKAPALGSAAAYRCSCGRAIAACGFWQAVGGAVGADAGDLGLFGGGADIRRAPTAYLRRLLRPLHRRAVAESLRDAALALSPAWRRHLARVQRCNARLARAACEATGKEVFVDSSKTGLQVKYLIRNRDLDVRVIRLVRDGRGVALSYRRADGVTISEGAYAWRRSNEEAAAVVAQLPGDRWFDLRYETLCTELQPTMHALFAFMGVEPRPVGAADASVQHVLGNDGARLAPGAVRLDQRWRRMLSAGDLEAFERIAGRLSRRLGY